MLCRWPAVDTVLFCIFAARNTAARWLRPTDRLLTMKQILLINDGSSDGTPVMVGEQETVGKTRKMIQVNSQDGYIILNNVDPFEVPAETTIYPLEYGDLAGQNKFTILFDRSISGANKDTTVLLEPYFTTTQNTPITISRKMPKMDFVIESNNRLWGCRYGENNDGDTVNEIYCSKQGDFKNWQCFEGVATDSYVASCGTDGEWTGPGQNASLRLFWAIQRQGGCQRSERPC